MRLLIAALSLVILQGSATAQMAGAEAQKAFAGRRIALSCSDGTQGTGAYRMTGGSGAITGTYTRPGQARVKDTGIVRAQGDNLCLRFKMLNGGAENCFGVTQTSARSFRFSVAGGLVQACTAKVL